MAVNILQCFTEEPPELDFVLPGYVANTVGCLAAAGATGKSFWSFEASMSVASESADKALLGLNLKHHGRVVILNAEDPETIIHQRLHSIGEHLPAQARHEVAENLQIEVLTGQKPDIMSKGWQDKVYKWCDGARLVIFDTFSRWHKMKENDNGEMSAVIAEFEAICLKTGAAVLFLHHVSKGMAMEGRQNEQQATRGAAAIVDNARWQGWMQTMSEAESELYELNRIARKDFVRVGGNKENYGQASSEMWLQRHKGGVLLPVELSLVEPKKATNNKKRR
jgi:RecA-family ATPase